MRSWAVVLLCAASMWVGTACPRAAELGRVVLLRPAGDPFMGYVDVFERNLDTREQVAHLLQAISEGFCLAGGGGESLAWRQVSGAH